MARLGVQVNMLATVSMPRPEFLNLIQRPRQNLGLPEVFEMKFEDINISANEFDDSFGARFSPVQRLNPIGRASGCI